MRKLYFKGNTLEGKLKNKIREYGHILRKNKRQNPKSSEYNIKKEVT
jgi:hypothetical protein